MPNILLYKRELFSCSEKELYYWKPEYCKQEGTARLKATVIFFSFNISDKYVINQISLVVFP